MRYISISRRHGKFPTWKRGVYLAIEVFLVVEASERNVRLLKSRIEKPEAGNGATLMPYNIHRVRVWREAKFVKKFTSNDIRSLRYSESITKNCSSGICEIASMYRFGDHTAGNCIKSARVLGDVIGKRSKND
jgi:hypothetical protein